MRSRRPRPRCLGWRDDSAQHESESKAKMLCDWNMSIFCILSLTAAGVFFFCSAEELLSRMAGSVSCPVMLQPQSCSPLCNPLSLHERDKQRCQVLPDTQSVERTLTWLVSLLAPPELALRPALPFPNVRPAGRPQRTPELHRTRSTSRKVAPARFASPNWRPTRALPSDDCAAFEYGAMFCSFAKGFATGFLARFGCSCFGCICFAGRFCPFPATFFFLLTAVGEPPLAARPWATGFTRRDATRLVSPRRCLASLIGGHPKLAARSAL